MIITLREKLWSVCERKRSDFKPYGFKEREGADCSCGCVHFEMLQDAPDDWGVCMNAKSQRRGMLTFEHQAGGECFVSDDDPD